MSKQIECNICGGSGYCQNCCATGYVQATQNLAQPDAYSLLSEVRANVDTRIWNCICMVADGKWSHGFAHDKIMIIVKEALEYTKKD